MRLSPGLLGRSPWPPGFLLRLLIAWLLPRVLFGTSLCSSTLRLETGKCRSACDPSRRIACLDI